MAITSREQAVETLGLARVVAEPIQRGDKPYAFTQQQLEKALSQCLGVYTYLGRALYPHTDAIDRHGASEMGQASGYARSLIYELLHHGDVDEDTRNHYEFIVFALPQLSRNIIHLHEAGL